MNKTIAYVLINLAIPFTVALLFLLTSGDKDNMVSNFFLAYGTIALIAFALNLIIGIILFIAGSNEHGKKLLLAAGVLLVISAATCGMGFGAMNFH